MIEWMRAFNACGRGRLQFTGFDMQTWNVAGDIVRRFVERAEPEYLSTLDEAYALVRDTRSLAFHPTNASRLWAAAEAVQRVKTYLETRWQSLVNRYPPAEVDWAIQNARVVEQATYGTIGGTLHRDEMMALNTHWILSQNPGDVEYMLHGLGMPWLILDLRKARSDNRGAWLLSEEVRTTVTKSNVGNTYSQPTVYRPHGARTTPGKHSSVYFKRRC